MAAAEFGVRHRVTLRFLDPALESAFQTELGAESLARTRVGALQAAVLWAVVGALVPLVASTHLARNEVPVLCGIVVNVLGWALLSRGAPTLDRQQAVIASINAGGGLCALTLILSAGGDVFGRYGAAGMMLTIMFSQLVVRMRFVAALLTSLPTLLGYVIAASLLLDLGSFAFCAFLVVVTFVIVAGSSYALERSTRELYCQRRVIAEQKIAVEREKEKSDRLLLNILPRSVAASLREEQAVVAESFDSATVLFADIVGFTKLAERVTAPELVAMLNELFSRFDDLAERHRLEKIKTIGDAYMIVGGLPERCGDHAFRVATMAFDMLVAVEQFTNATDLPLALRVGIHTGQVVAGVIGKKKFAYDLWGDTVNTASRMESHGVEGRIQVTEATYALVSNDFHATPRGAIHVKGKGEMKTWLLDGPRVYSKSAVMRW
jgi:class 3 adenylate cyclase